MSTLCTAAAKKKIKQKNVGSYYEGNEKLKPNTMPQYQCKLFIYLECGQQLCFSYFKYDVIELEKVKRSVARMLRGRKCLPYEKKISNNILHPDEEIIEYGYFIGDKSVKLRSAENVCGKGSFTLSSNAG